MLAMSQAISSYPDSVHLTVENRAQSQNSLSQIITAVAILALSNLVVFTLMPISTALQVSLIIGAVSLLYIFNSSFPVSLARHVRQEHIPLTTARTAEVTNARRASSLRRDARRSFGTLERPLTPGTLARLQQDFQNQENLPHVPLHRGPEGYDPARTPLAPVSPARVAEHVSVGGASMARDQHLLLGTHGGPLAEGSLARAQRYGQGQGEAAHLDPGRTAHSPQASTHDPRHVAVGRTSSI